MECLFAVISVLDIFKMVRLRYRPECAQCSVDLFLKLRHAFVQMSMSSCVNVPNILSKKKFCTDGFSGKLCLGQR